MIRRLVGATRHIVGIDLGTTHTVVATARLAGDARPEILPIAQLVGRGLVGTSPLLPSTLFSPLVEDAGDDPFGDAPWIVGAWAKARGEQAPLRSVSSPKSWLSHAAIDRLAPVLPWGSDEHGAPRLSPVEASARILRHLESALREPLGHPLEDAEIILTVPASFDQVARELTVRAATDAGLVVRLLEEPLAAFYDYLARRGTAELVSLVADRPEATILVCDVGGGTTDLTLVRVTRDGDTVRLDRVAVGRHVLLGGDNMDLALAHLAEPRLSADGERLSPSLFSALVQSCRAAKERLLGPNAPESAEVRILRPGSGLVGGTLGTTLSRAEVLTTVLDGFFPVVERSAVPARGRSGLVAFGLPYEHDPAITRHVAQFLARHVAEGGGPHAVLSNGGVFQSPNVAARLLEALAALTGEAPVVLSASEPELAVARGAVSFALALHGYGVRVGGGSPRGYYVGVSEPGGAPRAVCVVPRGSAEGERHVVRGAPLSLVVGEPARFELFVSDRAVHPPGVVIPVDGTLDVLPPMIATFDTDRATRGRPVAVHLEAELSAVGTLDVACVEDEPRGDAPRRHRLAFDLRGVTARPSMPPAPSVRPADPKLTAASALITDAFGPGRADADPRGARQLVRELEKILGERATWTTDSTRALFDVLVKEPRARKRSPDHERAFWMLAGYCLRPGYGHPKDGDRVGKLVPLFAELVAFPDEARTFQQFWIAWRRVAGGLQEPAQVRIRDLVDPFLSTDPEKPKKKKGFRPLAEDEMLELAAALERVPVGRRADLGRWVLERTWTRRDARLWTALGRIGARMPTYASVHHVVSPSDVARWLDHLLREQWAEVPTAAHAAAEMARFTGDRTRDVSESLRAQIAKRLVAMKSPASWVTALTEVVPKAASESAEFFGDSLPVGLVLG